MDQTTQTFGQGAFGQEATEARQAEARQAALRVLARAEADELATGLESIADRPEMETLRAPEFGLVMARGRIGGSGAPFNLGEVTVTRAALRLPTGEVGQGHVLGRDRRRAVLVATLDALWQSRPYRPAVERIVEKIRARLDAGEARKRTETAATKVNFFTMVRGEDT
ncbi:phosphonate C-P lyase system protein PhnG [Afifella sp. IM 167]|uniref:phosphonate C-P lyase system protein PhnG n=1 Tax=Afifella sp. IM 167 TaxID=2033586 RepID=UPI001CC9B4F5|nr:phosphonate C-P lyase system protein PhnG [Afifella sp. IM 167]